MDRDHILRKIKACLRLAASSNPNEAAAALRQAQAMMRAHGVTHAEAMDVGEAEVGTRCRGAMPPTSIVRLASLAGDGFGCQVIFVTGKSTVIRFYGTDGSAEIAAFAYTVLRRQMDADRLKHVARIRKRGNREARGEAFAQGFVLAVARLFPAAEVPEAKRLAIDEVYRRTYPEVAQTSGRDLTTRGKSSDKDQFAGYEAGQKAKLNRGIKGTVDPALEHLM